MLTNERKKMKKKNHSEHCSYNGNTYTCVKQLCDQLLENNSKSHIISISQVTPLQRPQPRARAVSETAIKMSEMHMHKHEMC